MREGESERTANPVQTTAIFGVKKGACENGVRLTIPGIQRRFFRRVSGAFDGGGGETRAGSNPAFGTIAILKGNLASRQVPFFRIWAPRPTARLVLLPPRYIFLPTAAPPKPWSESLVTRSRRSSYRPTPSPPRRSRRLWSMRTRG